MIIYCFSHVRRFFSATVLIVLLFSPLSFGQAINEGLPFTIDAEPGASTAEPTTEPNASVEQTTEPASEENTPAAELAEEENHNLRDPFWPIGWSPQIAEQKQQERQEEKVSKTRVEPQWDQAIKQLVVKGVVRTGEDSYVAMVRNQVVKEGEIVAARYGGQQYRWRVKSITRRGVRFEPLKTTAGATSE